MLSGFSLLVCLGALALLVTAATAEPGAGAARRVLLLGDSTVMGSVPHALLPEVDHLEDVIRKIISTYPDLPVVEVINKGQDSDTVTRMLKTRYQADVADLPGGAVDFVFIRYGLNDCRQPNWLEVFPRDYRTLIARIRKNQPRAVITLETVIPYLGQEITAQTNAIIRDIAAQEGLRVLDTHGPYAEALRRDPDGLIYFSIPTANVPAHLRPLLGPRHDLGGTTYVVDRALWVHLRDLPGWTRDPHPGLAGYQVIGATLAQYLITLLRE